MKSFKMFQTSHELVDRFDAAFDSSNPETQKFRAELVEHLTSQDWLYHLMHKTCFELTEKLKAVSASIKSSSRDSKALKLKLKEIIDSLKK